MKILIYICALLMCMPAWADEAAIPETQPTEEVQDFSQLIRQKLIEKYQQEIDDIIDRLYIKIQHLNAKDQQKILDTMRLSVQKKYEQIEGLELNEPRKGILLEILSYIIDRLQTPVE